MPTEVNQITEIKPTQLRPANSLTLEAGDLLSSKVNPKATTENQFRPAESNVKAGGSTTATGTSDKGNREQQVTWTSGRKVLQEIDGTEKVVVGPKDCLWGIARESLRTYVLKNPSAGMVAEEVEAIARKNHFSEKHRSKNVIFDNEIITIPPISGFNDKAARAEISDDKKEFAAFESKSATFKKVAEDLRASKQFKSLQIDVSTAIGKELPTYVSDKNTVVINLNTHDSLAKLFVNNGDKLSAQQNETINSELKLQKARIPADYANAFYKALHVPTVDASKLTKDDYVNQRVAIDAGALLTEAKVDKELKVAESRILTTEKNSENKLVFKQVTDWLSFADAERKKVNDEKSFSAYKDLIVKGGGANYYAREYDSLRDKPIP
jgi:hypothetical protein